MDNVFEERRITTAFIKKTLRELAQRMPDKENVVAIGDVPLEGLVVVLEEDELPPADCYVIAYEQDDKAASAMKKVVEAGGTYFSCLRFHPSAEYWRTNSIAQRVLAEEYSIQMPDAGNRWDTPDFTNITQAIEATRKVKGCYVEIGVFHGNSGRIATRYLHDSQIERKCWFVDTFSGFDYQEASSSVDQYWTGTHAVDSKDRIEAFIRSSIPSDSSLDISVLRRNVISDELPDFGEIAVCNLDVDMYEAVAVGLKRLAPMITDGGILICEDAGHTPALSGAFHALAEFLETPAADCFTPIQMASGQTFLIKNK
ncbi:MAG: TylF/MycF/NovP-related O-methyltransferase [Pseudomonadota bacterium]